jgi:hypothetical protein
MTDQQSRDIARGEHARRILDDAFVQEALAAVKGAIREQMFELPIDATKPREFLALMDKARTQFEGWFTAAIEGERIARLELAAEAEAMQHVERINQRMRAWLA